MPGEWDERVRKGLALLEYKVGVGVLMSRAHRDMVPWNMRLDGKKEIHVFDWEYSEQEYLPLYDFFHFLLMPKALSGRVAIQDGRETLQKVKLLNWHGDKRIVHNPAIQLLGYL